MLSKILLSINPVSPLNWIVALIVYVSIYLNFIKKQAINQNMKYIFAFIVYMILTIPIYMMACALANYIPPLRLLALFCNI